MKNLLLILVEANLLIIAFIQCTDEINNASSTSKSLQVIYKLNNKL